METELSEREMRTVEGVVARGDLLGQTEVVVMMLDWNTTVSRKVKVDNQRLRFTVFRISHRSYD